jgi:Cys-rich protein (TIGR01571 family)
MAIPILDDKFDETPIFSCFEDIQMLICSWCCGICTLARIQAGVRGSKEGCSIVEFITSWCLFPCCMFKIRNEMRQKYSKELDSPTCDQLVSCCCCSICTLSQMARHMDKSGELPPLKISM